MIRALRAETQRYGNFSVASDSVYDRPFQWGSKRTGPDLARVGGKYSDEWQRLHLLDPREFVPASNMPAYPWLARAKLDGADVAARMRVLRKLGDPYAESDIAGAEKAVAGKTELDALWLPAWGLGVARARGARQMGSGDRSRAWYGGPDGGVHQDLGMGMAPRHKRTFEALAKLPLEKTGGQAMRRPVGMGDAARHHQPGPSRCSRVPGPAGLGIPTQADEPAATSGRTACCARRAQTADIVVAPLYLR
jgi:cytochrome c oxidase cbb3-type subunit 2